MTLPYEPLEMKIDGIQPKDNIIALLEATIVGVKKSGSDDTKFSLKLKVRELKGLKQK